MNLEDYQKKVVAMFGKCEHGFCGTCATCRAMELVREVWASGHRSGASSSVERTTKKCLFGEWGWDSISVLDDLGGYVMRTAPAGMFPRAVDAAPFLLEQLEAMREWAEAKGERKVDWTMAMKGWIRRTLKDSRLSPSAPTSGQHSRVSRAAEEHEQTFREAMALNSPEEPPSQWPTSSGMGSRRTPPGSLSSSQIPLKSH